MFCRSMYCLYYVLAFLCFVVLCFVIDNYMGNDLSLQKCKHMHIGSHDINFEYTIQTNNGTVIVEKVTTEKDLGVIFDQKLKFTDYINAKVN